jgi:sulfur-oxidizing protein SoxZ
MAGKIKVKTKISGNVADIKSMMIHPMETGTRKDPDTGELVPMHHITQVTFSHNDNVVLVVNCSTAVSRNPFFGFSLPGAAAGDSLKVSWVDNLGETDELVTEIK